MIWKHWANTSFTYGAAHGWAADQLSARSALLSPKRVSMGSSCSGVGGLGGVSLWHSKGQRIWRSDMDDQVAVVMGIDPANAGDIISTSHLTKLFICPSKHFFIAKQYHNSVRLGCIHHCLGRPSAYWFGGKSLPAKKEEEIICCLWGWKCWIVINTDVEISW